MEKGVNQSWTPKTEEYYERLAAGCQTFAGRHLLMTVMETLKYDGRSIQGKRALAQARLRLATFTDDELEELARMEALVIGQSKISVGTGTSVPERLEHLKKRRTQIREKGIERSEIACQYGRL